MKNKDIFTMVLATILFSACKREVIHSPNVASLTIINAVTDGEPVRLGSRSAIIANNSSAHMAIDMGESSLYVWPVSDSSRPYFSDQKFKIEKGEVYSLFLAGSYSNVEGVLIKENLPYHSDSTCGIRFINLSPDSGPLSVNLKESPSVYEANNLDYKQHTDFKSYPAKADNTKYTFEIRKSSDDSLVVTYTLNTPRFANVTLVIRGKINDFSSVGITRVNNDR
ncbi:DUF4397 domain-containing protein [Longitalea luteola]|uniref:DUF4397 domain-containing protein n=1 Tax=Longitalea luteola TaxID=2812563 RepID=UPI001F60F297|nr:DUF4397 domain-containing protein [Longitalea luteola]